MGSRDGWCILMRLAVVMPLASPWAREAVLRLSELGHDLHVIDFKNPSGNGYLSTSDEFQSLSIERLRQATKAIHLIDTPFGSLLRYLAGALQLREILRTCEAEALLILYGGGQAVMAYASGYRPYAVYTVGSDILMGNSLKRFITGLTLNAANHVFANGVYLTHKTREVAPKASTETLYLGVDTTRFRPGLRKQNRIRIVCSRGFMSLYNNESLVHGLAVMPQLDMDFGVTFLSRGPLLQSVKNLADKVLSPDVRRRVEFLGGVSDEMMVKSLQSAHVYVSLSRSDGTSISLLEAMACGLFPVLSDIPQNREWIDSTAQNGILVPLDQPHVLAAALTRAITDHGLRARAAEFNRRLILERADGHLNMKILASKLEAMVRKI